MPLNLPKHPPYWNSTSGFDFDHTTAVDMSFCTSLQNFIQIGPPKAEKNYVMSLFKMADFRHLGFYGSNNVFFEKPISTISYRSSVKTIALNCLVFEKTRFYILATDRQTDGQPCRIKPLSLSRAAA